MFAPRDLPDHLAERTRVIRADGASGEMVLYWMHHAVRGHENPALDVALTFARRADLPLLVYQGLGGRHPFDNDRHHTFILEGARDVAFELAERGVRYVFHLGDGGAPLPRLWSRAALVVTDDFPAPPMPAWTSRLAAKHATTCLAVDASCVVPMALAGRRFDRMFRFRDATADLFDERVARPWFEVDDVPAPFDGDLGFEPTDLGADLAALVARCDIDHSVPPVPHTPGGSVAGYERWEKFHDEALGTYDKDRTDPTRSPPGGALRGSSKMSAYLHHGHVSVFRIARQLAGRRDKAAKKFLDELLIWRELAHNLCFFADADVESLDILPKWARAALEEHADDPRPHRPSAEQLARARTGDAVWDAAQRQLLVHGELHNNVRMTWGKKLLEWTHGPEEALRTMVELNHRYALDGSDPNSYGGLLWCLGALDRPFNPPKPILGRVRPRPTEAHARRLKLDVYRQQVSAPAGAPISVAAVGGGVALLAAARHLADHGHRVVVFGEPEQSVATTYTRRTEVFRRYVDAWQDIGVAPQALATHLAEDLDRRPEPESIDDFDVVLTSGGEASRGVDEDGDLETRFLRGIALAAGILASRTRSAERTLFDDDRAA